jgi:choline-glycine betaine transporter
MVKKIRKIAFIPAFSLMVLALIYNLIDQEGFLAMATGANDWLMTYFGWGYALTAFLSITTVIVIYFSPLGNVKLGGPNAKPMINKKNWFAITLCTTLAAGLLFWGTAEPIYHLSAPPVSLGIEPFSAEAAKFAMETMFLHWTFVPYALYAIPTIMFGFAFYNMKKPFSVSSQLAPITGKIEGETFSQIIDAICLFCLALGFASSMATSIINMGGAVNSISGIESGPLVWGIITIVGVTAFIISSSTGLEKGIRILSDINMKVYLIIMLFLFIVGPTIYNLNIGVEGFGGFLNGIVEKTLFTGAAAGDPWPTWWTTFYWANWMSWAPVSALFLARIARGYTIKDVIKMNFFYPGIFGAIWMTIFAGTAINFQMTGRVDLVNVLNNQGPEAVGYAILREFPLSSIIIPFFLFITMITFITAADSTTNAIAGCCIKGIDENNQEAPIFMKVIWGVGLGAIAYIMLSLAGITGIKTLSNVGGFTATILTLGVIISLYVVMGNIKKYDVFSKDYEGESHYSSIEDTQSKDMEV